MPATVFAVSAGAAPARCPLLKRRRDGLLDAILPPRCLACGAIVETAAAPVPAAGRRCASSPSRCAPSAACRSSSRSEEGSVCGACAAAARAYARARAAIAYDDGSRRFILGVQERRPHRRGADLRALDGARRPRPARRRRRAGAGAAALDAAVRAQVQSGGAAGPGGRRGWPASRSRSICCVRSKRTPQARHVRSARSGRRRCAAPSSCPTAAPRDRRPARPADRRRLHHRLDHRRLRAGAACGPAPRPSMC